VTGHRARRTRRLVVARREGAVGCCRDFVRETLAQWGWVRGAAEGRGAEDPARAALLDDVLLMVSELAANACMFADGPSELRLGCDERRLRLEMADDSTTPPVLRPVFSAAAPGGHGLQVIDRLARSWGYDLGRSGKTVWFETAAP
jgi:hypothetical protein